MAVLIVPLFCMLAVLGMRAWRRSGAEEHWRFTSSGGRFEIVVHRIPSSFAMRGGSSDAPGYFQLRDTRTGRVLQEQSVEMVQLVDQIHWSATNVEVHLLAAWKLPE
jgi:hypothetical protein